MEKKIYNTPYLRIVTLRTPRILAASEVVDIDNNSNISSGADIGAKSTSFGLWGDDEDTEE